MSFALILPCFYKEHHYFKNETAAAFNISTKELYNAYQSGDFSPYWTFSTAENLRIRFNFHSFGFSTFYNNFLEVGDGRNLENSSILAHFTGYDVPSNVTSVSNSAWLLCCQRSQAAFHNMYMRVEISAVEFPGKTMFEININQSFG